MNVTHPLAEAWLARLVAVSRRLPADRAAELEADLRGHLAMALTGAPDEDAVRRVLADLGDPEAVVAEAASDLPPTSTEPGPGTSWLEPSRPDIRREVTALCLIVGAPLLLFFPPLTLLAWLAGVVLLVTSRVWSVPDKVLGMLPALTPVAIIVLGLQSWGVAAQSAVVWDGAGEPPAVGPTPEAAAFPIWLVLLALLVVASIVAVVVLARRLLR